MVRVKPHYEEGVDHHESMHPPRLVCIETYLPILAGVKLFIKVEALWFRSTFKVDEMAMGLVVRITKLLNSPSTILLNCTEKRLMKCSIAGCERKPLVLHV